MDDAEDRGRRADAESEGDDREHRERRISTERPRCKAKIRAELGEPVAALLLVRGSLVHGSAVLPGVAHVTEPAHGFRGSRFGRNAASSQLGDAHVEVELELVVDVSRYARATAPRQADQAAKATHVEHGESKLRRFRAR